MADNKDASAALSDVIAGMDKFAKAANNHDVWIDGDKMREVLAQIVAVRDELDELLVAGDTGGGFTAGSYFGANPVGEGISQKFARRAGGEQYSLVAVLSTYREQVDKAVQAVTASLRDYHSTDTDAAGKYRGPS